MFVKHKHYFQAHENPKNAAGLLQHASSHNVWFHTCEISPSGEKIFKIFYHGSKAKINLSYNPTNKTCPVILFGVIFQEI
jgi:hypothetical protein